MAGIPRLRVDVERDGRWVIVTVAEPGGSNAVSVTTTTGGAAALSALIRGAVADGDVTAKAIISGSMNDER